MPSQQDIEQRLAFLGLTQADVDRLAHLRPAMEREADSLVAAFYRHLLSFGPTRKLLADPEVSERLRAAQRRYLISLAGPKIDAAYVRERLRIGETHARVGLEPRYYLGAYSLYFSLLVPLIREKFHDDLAECERAVGSLLKLLMLDSQLAMEAYIARHQSQLERLNRELAHATRSLTRDVEEQRVELRQTTERARAAEDLASVAMLAAGLAHEIGTPMGVIQGHAEALENEVGNERGRWRVRTIREQIERISSIIRALLGMARPRETSRDLVDVDAIVDTTLSFVAEKLRRRAIEVERDFEPVPSILGDAEKLQQLFLNLLLNAADAMQDSGGKLRLRLRSGEDDVVVISVIDSGTGIDPADLDRIFDPFFTTKPTGQGSGLGLVVAKHIVADHGGTIEVRSSERQGSEFRIAFPAASGGAERA